MGIRTTRDILLICGRVRIENDGEAPEREALSGGNRKMERGKGFFQII